MLKVFDVSGFGFGNKKTNKEEEHNSGPWIYMLSLVTAWKFMASNEAGFPVPKLVPIKA